MTLPLSLALAEIRTQTRWWGHPGSHPAAASSSRVRNLCRPSITSPSGPSGRARRRFRQAKLEGLLEGCGVEVDEVEVYRVPGYFQLV